MIASRTGFFSNPEIVSAVINSLSPHIALVDDQGIIVAVNEAWKQFARKNEFDLPNYGIGINYIEFGEGIHGEDAGIGKKICKALREIIAGKIKIYSIEYPCHSPTEQRWFKVVVTPLTSHTVKGAVVSHSDISARVLTTNLLKKSEEGYRALVEQASDGIFIAGSNFKILEVNNAACKQLGFSYTELQSMFVSDLFFEDDLEILPLKFDELLRGKNVVTERRFKRKDGTSLEVEINSIRLADGRYQGIARDITERKRAASLLAKKENHLRTILNANPECIKLMSKDCVCLSMNPAGLKIIEVDSEEEIIGQSILELIDEPDRPAFIERTNNSFLDIPGKMEMEITTIKGHRRWVESSFVGLKNADGVVESCLSISSDITDRISTKHALQKSHSRLKKSFANIQTIIENERKEISRELHDECGQKLTALHLDLAWLQKRFYPVQLEEIQLTDEMKLLVDSLMQTVQRISKNLRPPVLEYFNLSDSVKWLIADFEKRSKIKCQFTISVNDDKMYESLKITIFRILQESLTNALRHSFASRIAISISEKDDILNLEVCDNGKGFSTDEINNINSLGLLGMQERVEVLGGSISFTGTIGKGTNLKVSIPYKK